jgi:uncharacterized protein (TIGR01777 family)
MRVLVTGGTGFIGRALVGALRERGDEAVVMSRRAGTGAVGWDVAEREVEVADAVIHLAGEPIADGRWSEARLELLRDSRVQSTERLAGAIARASRKPRVFVSGSAVGYYGMRDDDAELDESAPPGGDVLAAIVVAWERAADAARSAGVRVVHPRTGVVLGRGGGALAKMVTPFRFFVGGPVGTGRQWVSWIHLRDAVRALLFAVDHEALVGPANVVAPAPVTMDTLSRSIGHALHRPSRLRVPAVALKMALGEGLAEVLLTGQRAQPRRLLDAGFSFDFTSVETACADLLASMP